MANFKKLSRYTNGKKTKTRDSQDFLILRQALNLTESADDIFVELTQELVERPDLIAYKAYQDVNLWWAIYEFNKVKDPFFELRIGDRLRLPNKLKVLQAIENLGKI